MRIRHLLCLIALLALPTTGFPQDDEPVFSRDEAVSVNEAPARPESPPHLATAYWNVTVTMDLRAAGVGTHVQMLLPLSDSRQSVLARRTAAEGVHYREEADGLNLWGHWRLTDTGGDTRQIAYEYVVEITDAATTVPGVPFPPRLVTPQDRQYLRPSRFIQSDDPAVSGAGRRVALGARTSGRTARALYEYVAAFPAAEAGDDRGDARSVIGAKRGGRVGKTRALVALLRAVGIPARVVGGVRLGDTARKRTTITWVEALVGGTWVPMDPATGYFSWLPNTYLALYRNDLPLLLHTRQAAVEYTFAIRQLTRSAALEVARPEGVPGEKRQPPRRWESEPTHTVAAYVDRPRANVVMVNDGPIPQGVARQILSEAQQHQVNVTLLSTDAEPGTLREHYVQSLLGANLRLLREANIVLLRTSDTAGVYALLKQGELGARFDDLHLVLAGGGAQPVMAVFAAVLVRALGLAEVVVLDRQVDLPRLWSVARTAVQMQQPLPESARRLVGTVVLVDQGTVAALPRWRRWVVTLWAQAVQARVPLPALNLILVLPLIAFFLVIIRNVIGLETFGTFSPMLLSLAFLTTGLGWGLSVFVLIVGIGTALRLVLQRLRLHLVSRVAILIAVVAVSMVGLTVVGAMLGVGALLHASIFPLVIMANLIESFTNTQLERGTGEALRLTGSTLLVATCSYVGIENTGLKPLVLTFPELLAAVIAVELLIGRWRGLRLSEYVRFRRLLREPEPLPAAGAGRAPVE